MYNSRDYITMDIKPSNNELIVFLETLISELKNRTLTLENYKLLLDFFLKHKFHNCTEEEQGEEQDEDWIKNLIMGWYIYNFCIKNNIESNK